MTLGLPQIAGGFLIYVGVNDLCRDRKVSQDKDSRFIHYSIVSQLSFLCQDDLKKKSMQALVLTVLSLLASITRVTGYVFVGARLIRTSPQMNFSETASLALRSVLPYVYANAAFVFAYGAFVSLPFFSE